MKSFKFRLQTVLEQRERVESLAKQSLAEAEAALLRGDKLLEELKDVRTVLVEELCRLRAGGFDPNETRVYHDYLQTITQSVREQEAYLRELILIREAHTMHLIRAAQSRQALSGVRDRHRQAFVAQKQRLEQNALDELAGVRHVYGQREG